MTIKIIVSIRHAAATNAPLLPLPPPPSYRISKSAAATAKIALLPSCHLHRQAGHRCRAAVAATSAAALPPLRYHCLQILKKCNTIEKSFFHHDGNGSTQRRRRSQETTTIAVLLFELHRIALMLQSDKHYVNSSSKPY